MDLDKIIQKNELKTFFYQIINHILEFGIQFLKKTLSNGIISPKENQFDGTDFYNFLIYRKKLVLRNTTNPDDENTSSSELISILSLSLNGLIKILNDFKNDEEYLTDWDFLKKYEIIPTELSVFSQPRKIFFSHLLIRCFDLVFEPICMEQVELNINHIINKLEFDFHNLMHDIDEIIDLELKKEIILEYYYFIYGINVKGDIQTFNSDLEQILVYPLDKDREKLSQSLGLPRDIKRGNLHSDYESRDLLSNTTGWIHSSFRTKFSSLDSSKVLKSLHLKPPEFFEEALSLLGNSEAKVRFYCRTSENSKINYSIDIHNGYSSSGSGRTIPNWVNDSVVHKWHFETYFEFNQESILFINNYIDFRFDQRENASIETLFGRFHRFITFSRLFDKIVEASIIFEVLILNKTDFKKKTISNRISTILSENPKQKQIIKVFIRKLYSIRNKIIHEGEFNLSSDFNEFESLLTVSVFLCDILRLCILRFIDFNKIGLLINKDHRIQIADNLLKSKKNNYFNLTLQEFWRSYPSRLKE